MNFFVEDAISFSLVWLFLLKCVDRPVLAPPKSPTMVCYLCLTLWGRSSWWWNTDVVLSVSKNFTLYEIVYVKKHISEVTHISDVDSRISPNIMMIYFVSF